MNRVTAFLFMLAVYMLAIADNPQKYREYADTIRNEVWNMDLPSFKSHASAEKYSDESAVILAAYRCISAKKKTGIAFNVAMLTNILTSPIKTTPQIHATDLYRRLIQINDRAALEKFSEFELVTREKTSNALNFWAYYKEDVNYVLGVRIIKPDGKIIVVDTNDFIDVKEGKMRKNSNRSLPCRDWKSGIRLMCPITPNQNSRMPTLTSFPCIFAMNTRYSIIGFTANLMMI